MFPTDTLYAIAADAFAPLAVRNLLAAKQRGPDKPASILIGDPMTAETLTSSLPPAARRLIETFWPGALSLLLHAAPTLAWNLGNTGGTVMIRMPNHPLALALLRSVGPLAHSSANLTGRPPATTFEQAGTQLGEPSTPTSTAAPAETPRPPSWTSPPMTAPPLCERARSPTPQSSRPSTGGTKCVPAVDQRPDGTGSLIGTNRSIRLRVVKPRFDRQRSPWDRRSPPSPILIDPCRGHDPAASAHLCRCRITRVVVRGRRV
nr:L-threonylcarbamoyladenylate synthase [Nocardia miyunensis]